MNCQRIQEHLLDLHDETIATSTAEQVRQHLKTCAACQREWSDLKATLAQLDRLPMEEPSPRLRANFYAMLEEQQRAAVDPGPFASVRSRADRLFAALLPARPTLQFAFSLVLLGVGVLVGSRYLAPSASLPPPAATAEDVAALRAQIESIGQLASYSLLQQRSTTERLTRVLATLHLAEPDQKILANLVGALALDPSTNVRLSALEALYPHSEHPGVRAGVLASLPRETSPLVQIAMIDFLVAAGDDAAAPAFESLVRNGQIDDTVRAAAQRALAQL